MRKLSSITCFLLGCLMLSAMKCRKDPIPPKPPVSEQLPAITQEGKNTFGCLLNDSVWIPYKTDFTRKIEVYYDPFYRNGTLRIIAERKKGDLNQSITMGHDNLNKTGTYQLSDSGSGLYFDDLVKNCVYNAFESNVTSKGTLNISKLDLQDKVISGTFEFTLAKPDCDTIKATNGRFDVKF